MADYKKEWFSKSQVDYFSSFVGLWLSCNSWYNFHYSLANDREHINKDEFEFLKEKTITESKKIGSFMSYLIKSDIKGSKFDK